MRITPQDEIVGLPSMRVRQLARRMGNRLVLPGFVADVLSISEKDAKDVLRRLRAEGYVERARHEKTAVWKLTVKGNALAMATAARPVKRSTAEQVLRGFMERVHQVNDDDYFLHKVTKVVVFGSYLGSTPDLGDLDLAVELRPKHSDRQRQHELERARIRTAIDEGRRFANVVAEVGWPQQEVRQFLKSRKRTISLHELVLEAEILKSKPHKVLYEEAPRARRRGPSR